MSIKSFVADHAVGAICTVGVLALAAIILLINWGIKSSRIRYAKKASEVFADGGAFEYFKKVLDKSKLAVACEDRTTKFLGISFYRKRDFGDREKASREFIDDSLVGKLSINDKAMISTTLKKMLDILNYRNKCIEIINDVFADNAKLVVFGQCAKAKETSWADTFDKYSFVEGEKATLLADIKNGTLGIAGQLSIIYIFDEMKIVIDTIPEDTLRGLRS